MELEYLLVVLGFAAFFAGLVDSIVGGGGLIQIPALFTAFPTTAPAVIFGTNKIASIVGTASAAVQYARRVSIPWRIALPGAIAALIGSWLGAKAVVFLPGEVIRPVVLVLLILVAIYTFVQKDFGGASTSRESQHNDLVITMVIGGCIGFYDGFFGPGTGSFFIFLLVRFVGMDFLRASATAKVLNVATNFAALSYFAASVDLMWKLGALMAACNLIGALVGSRLALKHGAGFVRVIFLVVVTALVLKMSFDLFM